MATSDILNLISELSASFPSDLSRRYASGLDGSLSAARSNRAAASVTYGAGNDVITVGDRATHIHAGNGHNIINSGLGRDYVVAGTGNDVIDVGDGNNTVWAGAGNNRVRTGSGNDFVAVGSGENVVYTGSGNDTIYTGGGKSVINAGLGRDRIFLGSGQDQVILGHGSGSVTIHGFDVALDKLRLDSSLAGETLTFTVRGGDTLVSEGGDLLATIKGVVVNATSVAETPSIYKYTIVDLGASPVFPTSNSVAGNVINDFGQIAGRVTNPVAGVAPASQAFVWDNGVFTALPLTGVKTGGPNGGTTITLPGRGGLVNGLNDLSTAVGAGDETFPSGSTDRGTQWTRNADGSYTLVVSHFAGETAGVFPLATPNIGPYAVESYFFDVNNSGQIAGRNIYGSGSTATAPTRSRPVTLENGVVIDLPTLGGDTGTARGINERGQIVGVIDGDGLLNDVTVNHAVLWERGDDGQYVLIDLGTLGADNSQARDINSAGQIIGTTTTGTGTTAVTELFVWQDDVATNLGSLGGTSGSANGINLFGQVVGSSRDAAGSNRAFVWTDGVMLDLNSLVGPQTVNGAPVTLTNATSVNSFGDIVVQGTYTEGTVTKTRSYLVKASIQ